MNLSDSEKGFLKKFIPISAFIAGLCCFSPVVLVLFGLSTTTFAASLANTFYGTYKWLFRGVALCFLLGALGWYFYKTENVCSLDAVKRKRQKIINLTLTALIAGILAYIVWLYVVVEYAGIFLRIW